MLRLPLLLIARLSLGKARKYMEGCLAGSTDQTNRLGIHAVAAHFTKLGWAFREQSTSDFGVDAQAEKLGSDGNGIGKLIALQIKTGPSYFIERRGGYVYYGEERHRQYWTNYALPVFIILHNPETEVTLWQRVDEELIEPLSCGRWSIQIPADQTLDERHSAFIERGIAADMVSVRRYRLALDLPLVQRFAQESEIFLRVEDWVNKTLNFRTTDVVFSDVHDDEAEMTLETWLPAHTIERFMDVTFPWLSWRLHEYVGEEEIAFEVAVHVLKVKVNQLGKALLVLDEFYRRDLVDDAPREPTFDPDFFLELGENDRDPDQDET